MKKGYLIYIILLVGFYFRMCGIGHGLPYGAIYHPDTAKQIDFLYKYAGNDYELNRFAGGDYYGYPTFHIHLGEWIYRILKLLANISAYQDWQMHVMGLYLMVRLMLAAMSTAAIYFIYRIGKLLFNTSVGLLSSLIFAVHPFPASMTHFIMGDTAMVFFMVVSAFFFARALKKNGAADYFLGAVFAGFSAGAKYNGIFVITLGIFSLFCNRRQRFSICLLMLVTGAVCGFLIGRPEMFVNFRSAVHSVFTFLRHVASYGMSSQELACPRIVAVWKHFPGNMHMFRVTLGTVLSLLSIVSAIWVLARKRQAQYVFILFLPLVYFLITTCTKPVMQPLYFFPVFPFLFVLVSAFTGSFRKRSKAAAFTVIGVIISICVYSSLEEAFFFRHPETRIIAHEWIRRNVLPCFRVSGSGYSIRDPYPEYKGRRDGGEFFVSSYLGGMPVPEGGIPVKEFSLENRIPTVIHRNPTLKVFVIPGRDIKKGFRIPPFAHASAKDTGTGFVFLNGIDFGVDPLQFQIKVGRKLILVSREPVRKIAVLLTNHFPHTEVKIKIGWKIRRVKLAPYETKMVMFEDPPRGFPFTKYFYKFSIKKRWDSSQVFVRVGTNSLRIGKMYYDAGSYGEAAGYLRKAQDSYERTILLAQCRRQIGQVGKEIHAGEKSGGSFEGMGIEEFTGLSKKYLSEINRMRFISKNFTSHRGWEVKVEERKCVAIECRDGEEDCIYGPYYGFPRGRFVARYNLKVTGISVNSKIKLDVAGRVGAKVIRETFLKPENTEGFVNVDLPFCIETPAEILEFRITLKGRGKIFLNKVDVFPDLSREPF